MLVAMCATSKQERLKVNRPRDRFDTGTVSVWDAQATASGPAQAVEWRRAAGSMALP